MTTPDTHHDHALAIAAQQPWHLAGALLSLKAAVDAHWPGRDTRSDGGIGDARHQAEGDRSDHNPWLNNTVRAWDFTVTQLEHDIHGVDGPWLAEQLRRLGQAGDPRLVNGGYVIFNRAITAPDFSHWLPYAGDPHTGHLHVSVTRTVPQYEYAGIWEFLHTTPPAPQHPQPAPAPPPAPEPAPQPAPAPPGEHDATGHGEDYRAAIGDVGSRIGDLQAFLNHCFPAYSHLVVDGVYGELTAEVVAEFAHRIVHDPRTPAEDHDGLLQADGRNVGRRIAAALHRYGFDT